ncbi:eukaryotic rRNA processing protein EBP2-domain-containing protein [Melampsora americana]|nr:eukaryotic rRNA processing protein EBP2-domain-containing protein [Melampsora americana]
MTEEELLLLDQSQHHREGEGEGSEFEGSNRSESESGSESGSEEDESVIDLEEGEDDEEIEGIEYEKMHVDSDNEDLGAMVKRKVVKNNTKALVKLLELMKEKSSLQLDFFDTQTIQSTSTTQVPDVNDDIGLEVELYKQALQGAKEAYKTFQNSSKEFFRPDDYFAEMIKSDAHMEKIRLKLISEMENIKASEESKKKRDLKKFGKAIQVEKRLEREKESKRVKEGVKELRKSEVVFFLSFLFLFLFFSSTWFFES